MPGYVTPRRTTSTGTTITVNSLSTTLAQEAGLTATNNLRVFHGNGLFTKIIHPYAGISVWIDSSPTVPDIDVTEDGSDSVNPAIGWSSHGVYDSVGKKVMWASTGQGINGQAGTYVRNTHAVFDETLLSNAGQWYANRAFIPPGGNTIGIGHQYGGNAIDVVGRRFYRQSFNENKIYVCDLDSPTLAWISSFDAPPQDGDLRTGAINFIPTIGTNGALWCYGWIGGRSYIWQKLMPSGSWTQIANVTTSPVSGLPMAYNPRSNKVLCGGPTRAAYIVDCANPASITTSTPPVASCPNFEFPQYGHLCHNPNPSGRGWLYISYPDAHIWSVSESGVWTDGPAIPMVLNPFGDPQTVYIVTPLEGYGVIWVVGNSYYMGNEPTPTNSQAWLFKPGP